MKNTRNVLMYVLIVITVLSLFFGFWGVYQTGKTVGLKEGFHKSDPLQNPKITDEFGHTWDLTQYAHDWFWLIGPGDILCFLFFILCFSGCIFRFFGWTGFWNKPYHRDYYCSKSCCEEYRDENPFKSNSTK